MGEECKYHVPVVVEKFNVLDCSSLRFFKLKHGLSKCMKEIQKIDLGSSQHEAQVAGEG